MIVIEAEENVGPVGCYSNAGVQCACVRANSIYHILASLTKKRIICLYLKHFQMLLGLCTLYDKV